MDYRAFEQRLLDTIFTTDVQLTPATIAFLYKISVQESSDLLQQAAVAGLLNIETDDEGNLLYIYPNRTKFPRDGGAAASSLRPDPGQREPGGLVRLDPLPSALGHPAHAGHRPTLSVVRDDDGQAAHAIDTLPAEIYGPGNANAQAQGVTRCPFCGEGILIGAKKCKHCHEYLDYALRDIHARNQGMNQVSVALQQPQPSQALVPWTGTQAALLSFFMPGLGQMCSGRVPAGLLWLMFTFMGYCCFLVPGFILHILCVINASRQPRQLT